MAHPQLKITRFRDDDVQSGDYPTWVRTTDEIDRFDRDILDPLMASMEANGQLHPVTIAVWPDGSLTLTDGHHRAVAAAMLGWPSVAYRWFRPRLGVLRPSYNYSPLPGGKK